MAGGGHAHREAESRRLPGQGSTASQSVLGPEVRVLRDRGTFSASPLCEQTFVTVHPSSLLRAPTEEAREEAYRLFIADLKKVAQKMKSIS